SAILKWLDQPMNNVWMVNTFFLIFQSLLIYCFCREEKKVEKVQTVVPEKTTSRNILKIFWHWLKGKAKSFAGRFNRFIEKLHMKNLFFGNVAIFIMAFLYFRLATMTLGFKQKPWQFLPGYVPGFIAKLYIAQKTGEGAAIVVKWLWNSILSLW
ncbi:hypothetical protein GYA13_04875, partial [Candidatus Kuenenbacteria bacterium]|nr:hypothetical protein [Candidatus Kuenenbacteria bacterium]